MSEPPTPPPAAPQPEPVREPALPAARVRPTGGLRRLWPVWIAVALAASAWAGLRAVDVLVPRGPEIAVRFADAHGLKPGDQLRHRGVALGEVVEVRPAGDLSAVIVRVRLAPGSEAAARAGSRFWIVRPELDLTAVRGLDTLAGDKYLAVLPGSGGPETEFEGLESPPVWEELAPGGLEVVLRAASAVGVRAGTPVTHRGVPVGRVVGVGLAGDGADVKVRAYVEPEFAALVRERTRFWNAGGLRADGSVARMRFDLRLDSLRSLVAGEVAMATPPDSGAAVGTGHTFALEPAEPPEWTAWRPALAVGRLLPGAAAAPEPLRAERRWSEPGMLFGTNERTRLGWVVAVADGLLGPADLLGPPEGKVAEPPVLSVGGKRYPLPEQPVWSAPSGAARVRLADAPRPAWPADRLRRPEAPEDCLAFGDPTRTPHPIDAARLRPSDGRWRLESAAALERNDWHGAAVVSRRDGRLIGVLVFDSEGAASVAPLPEKP